MQPTLPLEKQVAITIWKLGTPGCYWSVGHQFGVGKTTIGSCPHGGRLGHQHNAAAEGLLCGGSGCSHLKLRNAPLPKLLWGPGQDTYPQPHPGTQHQLLHQQKGLTFASALGSGWTQEAVSWTVGGLGRPHTQCLCVLEHQPLAAYGD